MGQACGPMVNFVGPIWFPGGAKAEASSDCQRIIHKLRHGLQQQWVKLVAPCITFWARYGNHGPPKQKPAELALK